MYVESVKQVCSFGGLQNKTGPLDDEKRLDIRGHRKAWHSSGGQPAKQFTGFWIKFLNGWFIAVAWIENSWENILEGTV